MRHNPCLLGYSSLFACVFACGGDLSDGALLCVGLLRAQACVWGAFMCAHACVRVSACVITRWVRGREDCASAGVGAHIGVWHALYAPIMRSVRTHYA